MWFYASAYSLARKNNLIFKLPSDFGMTKAFTLDISESLDDETMKNTEWLIVNDEVIESGRCCYWMEFHEEIYNLTSYGCRNIKLTGYFQSWKYFADYDSDIRRQFTFSQDHQQRAQENLKTALNSAEHLFRPNAFGSRNSSNVSDVVFVGVHIRLGDWKHDNLQLMADYLLRAVRYFVQLYANVIFVVCSNDQNWSKNNVHLEPNMTLNHSIWYSPHSDRDLDMAILTSCNHSIITVGTYGWWAAYLTGGTTIYFEGSRHKMGSEPLASNLSHYFYPGWIAL
jgi:galactoside 2-L-fucosyltransferase 1/2